MSIRTNTTLPELAELFRQAESFVVLSHYRPDGDAIGSSLAVALALQALGKKVTVINEDPVPETLRFLPGSEMIRQGSDITTPLAVDVAIAVDCANKERLGSACLQAISQAKTLVNLDHHRSNEGYGDHHHIDWISPATGQILWDFFQQTGLPLTKEVAENLYVAISTDTGSFQYENVTARTYEIGAEIMRLGVNIAELNRQTYESFPRRRIELLRGLLNEMEITHEGKVASWALRQELANSVGMKPEDAEGLIDTIRAIDGVIVALHLEELGDGKIRISLRSKDPRVDVGAVAAKFGGGGHTLAAGARFRGTVEEAKEQLFHAIKQAL